MADAFILRDDGATTAMSRIRCANEDRELQSILEKNHDLLPGSQIDPDNPRRWLLIKREMPVPDPGTGADRWSIDFFFSDQEAIPTFVECKRFNDTRSRREVIGQMLEYAANGHHYWTAEELREFAIATAGQRSESIEQRLERLGLTPGGSTDEFFARVQDNLREGQIRIVFFMEESPAELRSVVDFLNKQMERAEVLLVEARQYKQDSVVVVVPTLFGFTEEARLVKRTVTVSNRATKTWNESSFFAELAARTDDTAVRAARTIYDRSIERGARIRWGKGVELGSASFTFPDLWEKTLFVLDTKASMSWYWLYFVGRDQTRDALHSRLTELAGLTFPSNWREKIVTIPPSQWEDKADKIMEAIAEILTISRCP
jgi:hypothetical protein